MGAEARGERLRRVERRTRNVGSGPAFSICIPQYGRTSFLLKAIASIEEQTFEALEICVSDDQSPDERAEEVIAALEHSGRDFCWRRQVRNRRYDRNLRTALHMARGRYCFLLGNDDLLADPDVLARLHRELEAAGWPEVALTNYAEFESRREYRRVPRRGLVGEGPEVATSAFRNFSFVSGVIIDRNRAFAARTRSVDGSEMYQTRVACRVLSEGGRLWGSPDVAILKDVPVPGESVESYRNHLREDDSKQKRDVPLRWYARAAATGVQAGLLQRCRSQALGRSIVRQVLVFTYPFWIVERKRVASIRSALRLVAAMRPAEVTRDVDLSPRGRIESRLVWAIVSVVALLTPVRVFDLMRPALYGMAKAPRRQSAEAPA